MKNKMGALWVVLALLLLLTTGCGVTAKYQDGVYRAENPEFSDSGWKETVEVTIENGEVVKINWDAIYIDDSIPIRKKQYSKSGLYGMLTVGAIGEWYDQATAAEQFVLEHGIDALTINSDGRTDAVSGCTIHVDEFAALYRQCLDQAKKK